MSHFLSRLRHAARVARQLLVPAASRQYVFIIAYGRSGSTLMQRLIDSFPDAHITGENCNAIYPLYQSYLRIVETSARGRKPGTSRSPWYGARRQQPGAYAQALGRAFVDEVIRPPRRARLVGFKEIRYFEAGADFNGLLDFMCIAFPGAKLVFNLRTGDAIAKSGWWANQEPASVLSTLRGQDEMMRSYASKHPDRCLVLDYDEYVARPESLATLFSFLGVRHDPELVKRILEVRLNHARGRRPRQ
jgi:hypothetical protein